MVAEWVTHKRSAAAFHHYLLLYDEKVKGPLSIALRTPSSVSLIRIYYTSFFLVNFASNMSPPAESPREGVAALGGRS